MGNVETHEGKMYLEILDGLDFALRSLKKKKTFDIYGLVFKKRSFQMDFKR